MRDKLCGALAARFRKSDAAPYPPISYADTPIDSSKHEIRIIHLAPGNFYDEIRLTLSIVCLDDSPPPAYDALSYVWGLEQCPTPAMVNKQPMIITSNLDTALRYFRDKSDDRTLWVDAVCINQNDNDEKGPQVGMMDRVYSTASLVLVWLGPAAADSDELMEFILEGGEVTERHASRLREALLSIMSRFWFTRIWVQQEIALASEDPIIRCGNFKAPWTTWARYMLEMLYLSEKSMSAVIRQQEMEGVAARPLSSDSDHTCEVKCEKLQGHIENNRKWLKVQKSIVTLENLVNMRGLVEITYSGMYNDKTVELVEVIGKNTSGPAGSGKSAVPLAHEFKKLNMDPNSEATKEFVKSTVRAAAFPSLLSATKYLNATEPKDKVFGILGLAKFKERPISANYNKATPEVYAEAMATIINEDLSWSYNIWSIVPPGKPKDLPSWVPDLNKKSDVIGTEVQPTQQALNVAMGSALPCVPLARFSNNFQTLYAGGVELGRIQACFEKPYRQDVYLQNPDERFRLTDDVKKLINERHIPLETVWRTLIGNRANQMLSGRNAIYENDQVRLFQDDDKPVLAMAVICGRKDTDTAMREGLSRDDLRFIQQRIFEACCMNTLFITDTGRLGLVHGRVKQGDIVAGLFGIGLPFVLRKESSLVAVSKRFSFTDRRREGAMSYKMVDVAHIGGHELGHLEIPRDTDKKDLYGKYAFQSFVIN